MFGENCHLRTVVLCNVWDHFQHLYKVGNLCIYKCRYLNLNINILMQIGKLDDKVFICVFKNL